MNSEEPSAKTKSSLANSTPEAQEIDKVEIAVCLAAFGIFPIMDLSGKAEWIIWIARLSLIVLALALFFISWWKFRKPRRDRIYDKESKEKINEYATKLESFGEGILKPNYTKNTLKQVEPVVKDVIKSYLNNMIHDQEKVYSKAYREPLKERFAKTKHHLDMLARRSRNGLFAVGIILYLIVLISRL